MRKAAGATLLVLASLAAALLACEIGLRVWLGEPAFALKDFRAERSLKIRLNTNSRYDAALGWRLAPHVASDGFNTMEYGVRKNGLGETAIRTGGILAVGDSFTAGSEVVDADTWPALLERRLGRPVVNGGAGGYGSDQIVLRAEELLPIVRPAILLVGMLESDIERVGFSIFGQPKPYFTIDADGLVMRNVPVPPLDPTQLANGQWPRVLGYSLIVDHLMASIDAVSWYASARDVYQRIAVDEPEVVCRLLQRLKQQTDDLGIRTLLVMQHGSDVIRLYDGPRAKALRVMGCASLMGIQVVDEFASLKALDRSGPNVLDRYYVVTDGRLGHMSALGNELVAGLVEQALDQPPLSGTAKGYVAETFQPGDGMNLLPASESLHRAVAGTAYASLDRVEPGDGERDSVYRLAATGGLSEHYAVLVPPHYGPGAYTLSLEARAAGATCVRLQLVDEQPEGLLGDFDLAAGTVSSVVLGDGTGVRGGLTAQGDGWQRLWMSVRLAADEPRIVLQLAGRGCSTNFEPDGEAVELRAVQLERGQSASPYQPTSGLRALGFVPGEGVDIIAGAETLDTIAAGSPHAILTPVPGGQGGAPSFRLSAAGTAGEHYVVLGSFAVEPGPHVLSMQVIASGTERLRLHIRDEAGTGVIGDFDLGSNGVSLLPLGSARKIDGDIVAAAGGWRDVVLTTVLAGRDAHVLIQLMDAVGSGNFAPQGEAVVLRAVRLERGQSSSRDSATVN